MYHHHHQYSTAKKDRIKQHYVYLILLAFFSFLYSSKEVQQVANTNTNTGTAKISVTTAGEEETTVDTDNDTISMLRSEKEKKSNHDDGDNNKYDDGICSLFSPHGAQQQQQQQQHRTASSIWSDRISDVLEASLQMQELIQEPTPNETKKLLYDVVPPLLLRRSIRARPMYQETLHMIATKLNNRWNDPVHYPPLRVAVFGGSVTLGRQCRRSKKRMQDRDCAWPKRFETLVNSLFTITRKEKEDQTPDNNTTTTTTKHYPLIQVTNMAVGGVSSSQSEVFVKYWMYQDTDLKKHGPDIIINSNSANDALPPQWWLNRPKEENLIGTFNNVWKGTQSFLRVALTSMPLCGTSDGSDNNDTALSPPPPPPLVVHVDDYLGNQNDYLLGELQYINAVTQLANWYGTMVVSYADVVRDLVYTNVDENLLSADFQDSAFRSKVKAKNGKRFSEVHISSSAHQILAWVVAFAFLDVAVSYCDDQQVWNKNNNDNDNDNDINSTKILQQQQQQQEDDRFSYSGLHNIQSMPPPLTSDTQFFGISDEWKKSIQEDENKRKIICSSNNNNNNTSNIVASSPCELILYVGPIAIFNPSKLQKFMKQYVISNEGWGVESDKQTNWSNKLGWVATKPNAKFVFQIKNVTKPIRIVTLISMKSYGDKWKDSKARFAVSSGDNHHHNATTSSNTSMIVDGIHDSATSISYTNTMELINGGIQVGDTLTLAVDLIGGSTFKIQGLMFCSR